MANTSESLSLEARQQIIQESKIFHSIELGFEIGLSNNDIYQLSEQIANSVNFYNSQHPGEMLPKTPEDIFSSIENGESTIIVGFNDSKPIFLYHGAIYNLFNHHDPKNGIERNVFEFGTDIVNENFRNMGLGKNGVVARVEKVYSHGNNSVGLTTIKHARTARVWRATGHTATAMPWHLVPYLATLTDVCEGVNPVETGRSCPHRRTVEDSDSQTLSDLMSTTIGHVPCTLLTLDTENVVSFEDWARSQHEELTRERQPRIVNDRLNTEQFLRINEFYALLRGENV